MEQLGTRPMDPSPQSAKVAVQGDRMLRLTLRQLEYLIAVGDCQSVSVAAERVGVSAPSISAAIAQIEAETGLPLFVRRHAQGMVLTEQGRTLVGEARRVIEAARAFTETANRLKGAVRGRLAVGCLATFAQLVLPRLRRAVADAFPDVDFQQTETHQTALIEGLRKASLDVALTYDMAIPTDLIFTGLVELPPFAMFDAAHPLARRESVTIADLVDLPMILLDLPLSADYFLSFFEPVGRPPRILERTRDMALVQSMVANGFGYSIANTRPRTDEAPDGRKLAFVPIAGPVKRVRMGLLHASGAQDLPVVRAFAGLCRGIVPDYVAGELTVPLPKGLGDRR